MINLISNLPVSAPKTQKPAALPATPRVENLTPQLRDSGQARAAAETVRSGPAASPENDALMVGMKLAMARQTAQESAKHGDGETRTSNGDVVTVKGWTMEDPVIHHTVQRPDGSSTVTEAGMKDIRLTETAPDGTSTVTYGNGEDTITVEHRDASGQAISTDVYIYGDEGVEHRQVPGSWQPDVPADPNRNIGPVPPGQGQMSGASLPGVGGVSVVTDPRFGESMQQGGLIFSTGLSGTRVSIGGSEKGFEILPPLTPISVQRPVNSSLPFFD